MLMISITEYLEMIFEDFKRHNEEDISLCQLKSLTFAGGYLPNYNNIQIQRLYLLRYAFAYGFEYSEIYLQALTMLNNPSRVSVVSIGCGTFIDYWSLVQTIEKTKKINCKIEYVGIDEIDWNYKFDKRNIDEVYFEECNAIDFFNGISQLSFDIYFFPKSISEFTYDELNIMARNLEEKPILKDKIILCFSLRADDGSRERDMGRTQKIIDALRKNGFERIRPDYGYTYFTENKGIITYNTDYIYPQQVYDYVTSLNNKCRRYIQNGTNCEQDCISYLNRRPTMKTGNIYFQIIELERI